MKIETIKVIEKTISVLSTVWSSEDVYKLPQQQETSLELYLFQNI